MTMGQQLLKAQLATRGEASRLARLVGCTRTALRLLADNKTKEPSLKTARGLAVEAGIPMDAWFTNAVD